MKNTYYFSHDYNSRADAKIQKLLFKYGAEGYGVYWMIVESLYLNENSLELDYTALSYELRVAEPIIKSIINDFKLFKIKDGTFYSESIETRLKLRNEKSDKARDNANKRWKNANALPPSNPIKENKGKETKENDYNEVKFLERWKAARLHYDKQPTNISKLQPIELTNFNKLIELYDDKQFDKAISGLFFQETFPAVRLRPTHFLEVPNFEKYLTCWENQIKMFDKPKAKKYIDGI